MRRTCVCWIAIGSILPLFASAGALAETADTAAPPPAPAPMSAADRQKRAQEAAALFCGPEALETDATFVRGNNVLGAEPLPSRVTPETVGETARPLGVSLHIRAAPAVTKEWLAQVLECHRALGVLGRISAADVPDDPFWTADGWVDIAVRSEGVGFTVDVTTADPGDARKLQAQGEAYARAHAPVAAALPEIRAADPFAFADFTWLNGNSRQTTFPLDSKVFTGTFSIDTNYTYSFARPADHSLVGSTTSGRVGEIQISDLAVGGDFHWDNVRGRIVTQFGLYSTMQPRNDSSPSRGQWDLADAYRYLSEAYGGYHWDVWNGINLDVGLFMSYVGLCSYYDYENWVYQESYVSANTPWFFNGLRLQTFPSDKLKVELWLINGWQSYGTFNEMPGLGTQVLWRPTGWLSFLSNEYVGADVLGNPDRIRVHSDDSIQVKYLERPGGVLNRGAFSLTFDAGCESGGGVSCFGGNATAPDQDFIGFMLYNRLWFFDSLFGLTVGGGAITNPGRYLVLLPPINGATATSGTPYFTTNPGQSFKAWDTSITLDFMPSQYITFRFEYNHRETNVPYFAGSGGITPPGGNQGAPGSLVANWKPDLATYENRAQFVLMVRI